MRRLLLLRHAKSSWREHGIRDRDRPLNERGKRDAPRMAEALHERIAKIDLIVSSPAKRACDTAMTFARRFDLANDRMRIDERLYMASPKDFGHIIRDLPDYETILLAGHSTGMDELFHLLAPALDDHFPTCTVAFLSLPIREWKEFRFQHSPRAWKMIPRELPEEES